MKVFFYGKKEEKHERIENNDFDGSINPCAGLCWSSFKGARMELTIALIFAFGMNFITYWFSDKIVLKMYRAQQISES